MGVMDEEDEDLSGADDENADAATDIEQPGDVSDNVPSPMPGDDRSAQIEQYLRTKYGDLSDTSAVDAARADAKKSRMIAGIGEALEGMARSQSQAYGGQGVNHGVYQNIRAGADSDVQGAIQDHQAKVRDAAAERQMIRDGSAENRAETEFQQKQKQNQVWNDEHDPSSAMSQSTRTAYGKMFPDVVKSFGDDFNNLSAADIKEHLTSPLELKDKMKTNAAMLKVRQGERADAAADRKKEREDREDEKALKGMGDDLDPSKGRNGALGVAAQKIANAQALQALAQGQGDNLDSRQMEELAIGLNKLLSGSNASASSQVEALVPSTARGDAAKLKEWLFNEPTGTNQKEFAKRMMETVGRESKTARNQIETYQRGKLGKYEALKSRRPDQYGAVLKSFEDNYGVNLRPKDKEAGAPASSVAEAQEPGFGEAQAASAGQTKPAAAVHPQANAALEYAKKHPEDPRSAEIIRRLGGQ
jgi:hypothetical protein